MGKARERKRAMKKMKKIFAVLLTLAMVLGMSATTFAAASATTDITVNGLISGGNTEIKVYKAISLGTNGNSWVIAEWAKSYIKLSQDGKSYTITDKEGLGAAVKGDAVTAETVTIENGTVDTQKIIKGVGIGAYVIDATSAKGTYNTMVVNTEEYGQDGLITAASNVTVVAKTGGYNVDKTVSDNSTLYRGKVLDFTINTTFPTFEDPNPTDGENTYEIVDTSTGLVINTDSLKVMLGTDDVTSQVKASTPTKDNNGNTVWTLDLSDVIGTENANGGKTVKVTYQAVVDSTDGYENVAVANRNDEKLGEGKTEGKDKIKDITVTKVDADDITKILNGAEFNVVRITDGTVSEPLKFVKVSEGVYKLAIETGTGADPAANIVTTVAAPNGTVKVTGLEEGIYKFIETKAPEGYSVDDNAKGNAMANVDVTENKSATGNYTNTKLASLPSTGGMGTTIFTIGGCLIMIVAAGLYFANRRKASK